MQPEKKIGIVDKLKNSNKIPIQENINIKKILMNSFLFNIFIILIKHRSYKNKYNLYIFNSLEGRIKILYDNGIKVAGHKANSLKIAG